ncbi:GNAT family N-acetyltransferase [Pseudoteredinibacter isoporae]|uniref:Putative GNAT family N-acyltransferase n=1 Tax=Pseudoteredinibacter isoporae TaxID=570281 RepID=A0A7X0MY41_9GAMM|nr:GNAT family N-acetyltransferase [Pseudoteredinibacter isoporae]MBB6521612.1 putative GNAT family N-acyltransferase [Pseudoteredinibacter isoporae]NHO87166.1 GNAT family N-acetyltransferase [Pseudoteredinibacter isoporae]NIB22990.1 GNAT family N-acetyltransferase [Pseudoteredinibacter isoporae]
MAVTISKVDWQDAEEQLMAIRREVFIEEQGVPEDEEIDPKDPQCTHFLATDENGKPVGTSRLLPGGQIGRMAVLSSQRGTGLGGELLMVAVNYALEQNYSDIFLHAQTQAIGFYQRYGFEAEGPEFMDAGIPHRNMIFNKG